MDRLVRAVRDRDVALLHPDVDWPGVGARLRGRDAVASYWQLHLETIEPVGDGESVVHHLVRDLSGKTLVDRIAEPTYSLRDGLIAHLDLRPRRRPVVLVPYDPAWPTRFAELAAPIAGALGDVALAILHVGSTSVPGLLAKPIIDMDVVLRTRADLPEAIRRVEPLGYRHRGELGIRGRDAFRGPPGHNLYVCARDSPELDRHLRFRNHLRTNPDVAQAYGELKRRLAATFPNDVDAYCLAKTEFVESVLRRA